MKYLLMIIMFVSCVLICLMINKPKKDRQGLLNEIKNSIKSHDIHNYFNTLASSQNIYIPRMRIILFNVSKNTYSSIEAKDKMLKSMNQVFFENSDNNLLLKWLGLISQPDDKDSRNLVDKECIRLIEHTKNQVKSNMYIAVAIAVVMIIVVI